MLFEIVKNHNYVHLNATDRQSLSKTGRHMIPIYDGSLHIHHLSCKVCAAIKQKRIYYESYEKTHRQVHGLCYTNKECIISSSKYDEHKPPPIKYVLLLMAILKSQQNNSIWSM